MQMADGPAYVVANSGYYDMQSETVDIEGPVALRAADGYALNTRDVRIALATRTASSGGPVDGSMPIGRFAADRIHSDIAPRTLPLDGGARRPDERRVGTAGVS